MDIDMNDETTTTIFKISDLLNKRTLLLKEEESSWNEVDGRYEVNHDEEIDRLADIIYELLLKHHTELPVETVIETLTMLGDAPCLLYDDNGHFAVDSTGFGSVSNDEEPCDCHLQFIINADSWKDTIREALAYYLKTRFTKNETPE